MKNIFLLFVIFLISNTVKGQQTIPKLKVNEFKVESTTKASHPCPSMTDTQMIAVVSPQNGDCVHNTTLESWLVYNSNLPGWEEVGGGGGILPWASGEDYEVNDVVIESNKIYKANTAHTSTVFATQIANWDLIASRDLGDSTGVLSLDKGGSNKNITASNGAIVYSDTDSFELLSPGSSGQILQSNGVAAPSFVNKSILSRSQEGTSITLEEIQAYNNQFTSVDTNKRILETGNNNLLINPSFEHSTFSTGWIYSGLATFQEEPTDVIQGKKSAEIIASTQTFSLIQETPLKAGQLAGNKCVASVRVKSNHTGEIEIYPLKNGIAQTSIKQLVNRNNQWGLYRIQYDCDATFNGIEIDALSGTGTTYVDDAYLGVEEYPANLLAYVDNDTALTTFTPTGSWVTNTTYTGAWWRSGQFMNGWYQLSLTGAPTAANLTLNMPSGYVIDTAAIASNTTRQYKGSCYFLDTGVQAYNGRLTLNNSTSFTVFRELSTAATGPVSIGGVDNTVPFTWGNTDVAICWFEDVPIVGWTATNPNFLSAPDTFSTDTNTLTFKTSAVTSTDPVGTFSTYSYTASSNTITACATAPTQTTSDMSSNGLLVYSRAWNAASTCAQPSLFAIRIGRDMKGRIVNAYASTGKTSEFSYDIYQPSGTTSMYGTYVEYNELTGILYINAGYNLSTTITSRRAGIITATDTNAINGYFTINASKNPALTGFDLQEVVKSQGQNGADIQSVYFGTGALCNSQCTTGSCTICNLVGNKITSVTRSALGNYQVNGIDGTKYNCTGSGVGGIYAAITHSRSGSTSSYALIQASNGAVTGDVANASVICIGKP